MIWFNLFLMVACVAATDFDNGWGRDHDQSQVSYYRSESENLVDGMGVNVNVEFHPRNLHRLDTVHAEGIAKRDAGDEPTTTEQITTEEVTTPESSEEETTTEAGEGATTTTTPESSEEGSTPESSEEGSTTQEPDSSEEGSTTPESSEEGETTTVTPEDATSTQAETVETTTEVVQQTTTPAGDPDSSEEVQGVYFDQRRVEDPDSSEEVQGLVLTPPIDTLSSQIDPLLIPIRPNCDILWKYRPYVLAEGQEVGAWLVLNTERLREKPEYFVVRYIREDAIFDGKPKAPEAHFQVFPNLVDTVVDMTELRLGNYLVQVCAATKSFTPTFTAGGWSVFARTYSVNITTEWKQDPRADHEGVVVDKRNEVEESPERPERPEPEDDDDDERSTEEDED